MKLGLYGSLALLLTGGGLAIAQPPTSPILVTSPPPVTVNAVPAVPQEAVIDPTWMPTNQEATWWVRAEYLLWWFKKSPVPVPLLTTTSSPDLTPLAALNQDGTSVLLGNQSLDTGTRQGARFSAGMWLDDRGPFGLEANYFVLASRTVTRGVVSTGQNGSAILAVPFFDADAQAESSFVLASPSSMAGAAALRLTSRLQGAELNGCVRACTGQNLHIDVLTGFRFVDLRENFSFATASAGVQDPGDGSNNGLILNTLDQIDTHNLFYGFQIGGRFEYQMGGLSLTAIGKLALGDMQEIVSLNGLATTNFFNAPPGGPFTGVPTQVIPGAGTFVQGTNIGRATRHQFGVVPELQLDIGYQVTDHIQVFAGYNLLFLSNVVRPGNQIDRNINFSETLQSVIAGNAATAGTVPTVPLTGSEFWTQGISFGVEFRY